MVAFYLPTLMAVLLSALIFILFRTELHPSSYPSRYYKVSIYLDPPGPPKLKNLTIVSV